MLEASTVAERTADAVMLQISPFGVVVLAVPILSQLPAHVPGKIVEGGPSHWAPAPMWEASMKYFIPCFCLGHI